MIYCAVTGRAAHGIRIGDTVWLDGEAYRVTNKPDMVTFDVMPEWAWSDRQFQRFLLWMTAGAALFYGYVGLWHFLG